MRDKKLIALIVLVIAAVFSLAHGIFAPSRLRRQFIAEPKGAPDKTAGSVAAIEAIKRDYKHTTYTSWGRDPFSAKTAPLAGSTPVLCGILWDKDCPRALIGNRIVSAGDKVGENTVAAILEDRVILNNGKQDFELKLKQSGPIRYN